MSHNIIHRSNREIYWSGNKVIVLCRSVYKYFGQPEATHVRREMVTIETMRRFHLLIWDTIVSDVGYHKGVLSRDFLNYLLIYTDDENRINIESVYSLVN